MTSKHCPYKDTCRERGGCENCDHGLKYEQMGHKIIWLEKEKGPGRRAAGRREGQTVQEVLISIRRPNTDRIFTGTKTVELRRTVPKNRPEWGRGIERSARKWEYKYSAEPAAYPMRVWMYESRAEGGAGGIVGFFLCFGWAGTKGDHLPEMAERAQVTMQQLRQYAGDGWVYGWNVDSPTKLAEPVPLGKIGLKHPPQSWRYLDAEAAKILEGVADHAAPAE